MSLTFYNLTHVMYCSAPVIIEHAKKILYVAYLIKVSFPSLILLYIHAFFYKHIKFLKKGSDMLK